MTISEGIIDYRYIEPCSKLDFFFLTILSSKKINQLFYSFGLAINRDRFSDEERNYVCEWVNKYQGKELIRWKHLQIQIQKDYGKFRLRNDLISVWNANKRRQLIRRQSSAEFHGLPSVNEDDEYDEEYGNLTTIYH
jgi:hypothetical protein